MRKKTIAFVSIFLAMNLTLYLIVSFVSLDFNIVEFLVDNTTISDRLFASILIILYQILNFCVFRLVEIEYFK